MRRVRHHQDDDIARRRHGGAARLGDATGRDQVIRYAGLAVEMQLVAALDQVERHRLAHDAEPDETDLHGGNLPLGCAVDWVDSTRSAWPRQAFPAGPGQACADSDSASRAAGGRSAEQTSELQSLIRISVAASGLKKKIKN